MKKAWLIIILIPALGMGWLVYRRIEAGRAAPPRPGVRPIPVETAEVRRETLLDERPFRGTLESRSHFVLAPKVAGRLERLAVDVGDTVHPGDTIAVLDDEEYALLVAQAQAELDVSEASLEDAESAYVAASSELRRAQELHAEKVASDARLEEAEARQRAAEARVKLARAQIRQREAALQSARVRMGYTKLSATWENNTNGAWLVARRYANEGSMLRANDPVVALVDIGALRAVVHAIERDFPLIAPGLPAFLQTDAWPDEVFEGVVARRAPVIEEGARHARVEIEVDNADGRLAPGMFVRARIRFATRENARVVPLEALTRREGREGVFVVEPDTLKARFVEVVTGIRHNGLAEVLEPELSGLVVTMGHHLLEDGGMVTLPAAGAPTRCEDEQAGGRGGPS